MTAVAFVTCARLPELAADDRRAVEALRARGVRVDAAAWDDPAVRWDDYDSIVVRSTWDYHRKPAAFAHWIDRMEAAGAPLWNPASLLRWNMRKSYLRDLEKAGVDVVPTAWAAAGSGARLERVLSRFGWDEAVVKPAISANGDRTWRTSRARARDDQARFARMLATSEVMVQPFVEAVREGEWSFVFIAGAFSHAVRKRPRGSDFRVQADYGGSAELARAPDRLVRRAARVVEAVRGDWLYARVDACDANGALLLMELEMLEPSLFFDLRPEATERFADAVVLAAREGGRRLQRTEAMPALRSS